MKAEHTHLYITRLYNLYSPIVEIIKNSDYTSLSWTTKPTNLLDTDIVWKNDVVSKDTLTCKHVLNAPALDYFNMLTLFLKWFFDNPTIRK